MRTRTVTVWVAAVLCAVVALVGAACGSDENDQVAAGSQSEPDAGSPEGAYAAAGCSACHGTSGEGGAGPALAGHTAEQVVKQVRSPVGAMPLFDETEVSDDQLQLIVQYVEGLGSGEGHEHHHGDGPDTRSVLEMHHFMALEAITAGNNEEALHHLDHILELVEGAHAQAIEDARDALVAGDTHEAQHLLELMLTDAAVPDLSPTHLHLHLALQALVAGDQEDAQHHVQHAQETVEPSEATALTEILDLLAAGQAEEAEAQLRELTGSAGHESSDDHHDDSADDHHDEGSDTTVAPDDHYADGHTH